MSKKQKTFEQAIGRLEEIVVLLDSGEESLEQSLELFSEGTELIAFCNKTLEQAKLRIETLFPEEEERADDGI